MRKQTKIWKCRDGRRLRICDMESGHIKNTMRLLEQWAKKKRQVTMSFYMTCIPPQGECALMAFEQEFDQLLDSDYEDFLPDIYFNMKEDLERRDITKSIQPLQTEQESIKK